MKHINRYTLLIIVIIGLLILYKYNPLQYWFWPKCPIKLITGLNCPACGIQRFIHTALQGDFIRACHYNYYLLYALPYVIMIVVTYYLPNSKIKVRLKDILESTIAVRIYVTTFFIWFIARNILNL
ncbi:DUF2752 domain-containing protein [Prevotella copri]|uniref:DUF2752 domain-containing protein n=1 Tax=Segatella copri TaxID=165179 RepID=UPI00222E4C4A|nr:DUF2752 domain-containing protein [Segatella copri]MCW4117267.1 DUF2752 domain-containing protein [Segatella copri]